MSAKLLSKLMNWLSFKTKKRKRALKKEQPIIHLREHHIVSRTNINRHALKVLYRLKDAGFQAYLVGGGVRDVLLERHPKDFDLATNARPEQIQKLFHNCRLIGRRFRLAHVHFGSNIVEVATFRGGHSEEDKSDLAHSHEGMIVRDNIYGTLEEDVWRRDFTVNALYYNIVDFTIIDYVGGLKDLKTQTLRMIGDASTRYREDPVRMLRAIRFAAKLNFHIHKDTEQPIFELGYLIKKVPSARLFDEYLKLFLSGYAVLSFQLLRQYGLLELLFPQTERCLQNQVGETEAFLQLALSQTDKRVAENKSVAPPFMLAALLWYPLQEAKKVYLSQGLSELSAFHEATSEVLGEQQRNMSIPRRLTQMIREIWGLQIRLAKRSGHRAHQVYHHPRFRAAYDFLLLRAEAGEKEIQNLLAWWTEYIGLDEENRVIMANTVRDETRKKRSFKRPPRKRFVSKSKGHL